MTARRRFGSVRKLPSGRWQARYRDAVGLMQTAEHTFGTKTEAARWLSLIETDLYRGDWTDPRAGATPFKEWADRWVATIVDLRPSTRARDEAYLRSMILPEFESVPVGQIDHLRVRQWVADLSASGRAPATVRLAAQILSKILRTAVASNAIRLNPCVGVPLPRIERKEMLFLEPVDVVSLAASIDQRYRALVYLGAYGGLRAGELFGLTAGRFDPMRARVDVAEIVVEVRGHLLTGPPKTRAGRRQVPLPAFVAEQLTEHYARHNVHGGSYVFPAPEGGAVRLSEWRRRTWQPAAIAAGLGAWTTDSGEPWKSAKDGRKHYSGLRIHDLRHTAVAFWIAAGLSPKGIADRAGHASVATVLDRYGHLLTGSETAADDALDALARAAQRPPLAAVVNLR